MEETGSERWIDVFFFSGFFTCKLTMCINSLVSPGGADVSTNFTSHHNSFLLFACDLSFSRAEGQDGWTIQPRLILTNPSSSGA